MAGETLLLIENLQHTVVQLAWYMLPQRRILSRFFVAGVMRGRVRARLMLSLMAKAASARSATRAVATAIRVIMT